jgi:hypothetical protein
MNIWRTIIVACMAQNLISLFQFLKGKTKVFKTERRQAAQKALQRF